MNSKDFYCYWNWIEKRAFLPTESKGKGLEKWIKIWLRNFEISFFRLIEGRDKFPAIKPIGTSFQGEMEFPSLGIYFKYTIEVDLSKFGCSILWGDNTLHIHYDKQYLCEFDYLLEHGTAPSLRFNREELLEVLKNKIEHPAVHCHIQGKITNTSMGKQIDFPHDIRIGMVSKNPFLFLYQIAFQFLIVFELSSEPSPKRIEKSKKQKGELDRLADLILGHKDKKDISPGILFGN